MLGRDTSWPREIYDRAFQFVRPDEGTSKNDLIVVIQLAFNDSAAHEVPFVQKLKTQLIERIQKLPQTLDLRLRGKCNSIGNALSAKISAVEQIWSILGRSLDRPQELPHKLEFDLVPVEPINELPKAENIDKRAIPFLKLRVLCHSL